MTKEELRQLSDQTFYDNNVGGITPPPHRVFNGAFIDSMPEQATDTTPGLVRGGTGPGQVFIQGDGTMTIPVASAVEPGVVKGGENDGDMYVNTDGTVGLNGWSNLPYYTYVVDSDEALEQFADNVPGNDYTSVLIKKGDWTLRKALLFPEETVVITGEYGSRIIVDIPIRQPFEPDYIDTFIIGPRRLRNYYIVYDYQGDLHNITIHIKNMPYLPLIGACRYIHNLHITNDETCGIAPEVFVLSCSKIVNPKIQLTGGMSFYLNHMGYYYSYSMLFYYVDTVEGACIDLDIGPENDTGGSDSRSISLIHANRIIRCVVNARIFGIGSVTGISGGKEVDANELTIVSSRGAIGYKDCYGMRLNSAQTATGYSLTKYKSCYASQYTAQAAGNTHAGGWNS